MATFPAIAPTARNFKQGDYPSKTYRSLSGYVVKRSFGNRATGYELDLEYRNISESVLNQILLHYDGQNGTLDSFSLPSTVMQGYSTVTRNKVTDVDGIKWFYVEAPQVTTVIKNISTVQVRLIGEITK